MRTMLLPFFRVQHNCVKGTKEEDLNISFVEPDQIPRTAENYLSGLVLDWVNELVGGTLPPAKPCMTPETIPVINRGDVAYAVVPMGVSGAPRYRVHGNSEISIARIQYQ